MALLDLPSQVRMKQSADNPAAVTHPHLALLVLRIIGVLPAVVGLLVLLISTG